MEQRLVTMYNDRLAEVYDKATSGPFDWTPPHLAWESLRRLCQPNLRVLDLGVGTGQSVAPLVELGCDVVGVDISETMLQKAREKYPSAQFVQADIETSLPVDGLFDLVLAIGVLEFVADLDGLFRGLIPHLHQGSLVCFTFELYLPDHPVQNKIESMTGEGPDGPGPEIMKFPTFRRTPSAISELLSRHGLVPFETSTFTAYHKFEQMIPIEYGIVLARLDEAKA